MGSTYQAEAKLKLHNSQEVFSHKDDDGILRVFLVGTMLSFIEDYPQCADILHVNAPIDPNYVQWAKKNMGIEQPRLDRLQGPYLSKPCIGIFWPDNKMTIVDGNHRIVKRYESGFDKVNLIIFKYPLWENFILAPEEVQNFLKIKPDPLGGDSGVLEFEKKQRNGY